MSGRCEREQTDERVTQYFSLDSWLFWAIVLTPIKLGPKPSIDLTWSPKKCGSSTKLCNSYPLLLIFSSWVIQSSSKKLLSSFSWYQPSNVKTHFQVNIHEYALNGKKIVLHKTLNYKRNGRANLRTNPYKTQSFRAIFIKGVKKKPF